MPPTKFDGVLLPHGEELARVDLIARHPTGDRLLARWNVALNGVAGRHQERQHKPLRCADDRRAEHRPRASQIEGTTSALARMLGGNRNSKTARS